MINIEDALQRMHQAEQIGEVRNLFDRKKESSSVSCLILEHGSITLPTDIDTFEYSKLVCSIDLLSIE